MDTTIEDRALLQISGLSKRFGGVQALRDVGFDARAGEVLALVGENGAGKSTLVKILTGIHLPDAGTITLGGQRLSFANPQEAAAAGIAAVQQEPSMFDDLTVAENMFVGAQPKRNHFGGAVRQIDWATMRTDAERLLADIGSDIPPDTTMRRLSVAERHMVSLARALSTNASVIIFDEPTAALSQTEIRHLYGIIEDLKSKQKAILFISHKFDEIFRIADAYAVLRDGAPVGAGRIADTNEDELIRLMVGRDVGGIYPKAETTLGEEVLRVDGFCHPTEFADVSFSLRAGEIVGFYGLVGAGRTEVMEALFGLKSRSGGQLTVDGKSLQINRPDQAIAAGIAYVPEDRQRHGALLPFSIRRNISLPLLSRLGRWGLLNRSSETALADDFGERVSIKARDWDQPVGELSGGNQQKVVIGKWLATNPRVIILDEPTKGIDVGSKSAVHETIAALVHQGLAVILVTSELDEALGLADRLIVMARGRIAARFERRNFSRERVLSAASEAVVPTQNIASGAAA